MIGAAIFLYLIKKYLLNYLIRMVYKQKRLKHKQKRLVYKIRKPLENLLILANINLVLYIYNDFSSMKVLTPLFNILYILIVMWSIYRVLNTIADYKIKSIAKNHTTLKSELVNISIKIINFILLILTILFVLSFMGINLTAILSGLGIGGLAIALAAKDSLANFFGTLSILLSDTFSQGDLINVGDIKGTVVEIGLRVTTIRTFDNALISAPNSTLANGIIKNLTKRKIGRRIKMKISLRHDSKKESIKKAVKEIEEMLKSHENIAKRENVENIMVNKAQAKIVSKEDLLGIKYLILVSLDEFGKDSIDILVYCFTKSVDWESWLNTKSDVMEKIMDILEKNNLEFAYPSLAVYQKGNQS
jgi:MscS family membrane protein